MMISLFLLTITLCLSKVTIHSLSHNCPIEMRLKWTLGEISACFTRPDKKIRGILYWCVDAIVDGLGSFTLIEFLVAPLCCIILSDNLGSVLCILSRLVDHLYVVVVGIEYY